MKISSIKKVLSFYEKSADSYDKMMDTEINLPIYSDTLRRLAKRIAQLNGPVVDTSCGSGHMLHLYRQNIDLKRPLIAIDISPEMIEIAGKKLEKHTSTYISDMRDLSMIPSDHCAALISYFAIHHLSPKDIEKSLKEWCRVLCENGQLIIGAWEGKGSIGYGEKSDLVAYKFPKNEIENWLFKSGFTVNRFVVEFIEEMEMNAAYIEATKESVPNNALKRTGGR
jgi:ubiquinone/menaquinone biosynthesis C-methylase UbiE